MSGVMSTSDFQKRLAGLGIDFETQLITNYLREFGDKVGGRHYASESVLISFIGEDNYKIIQENNRSKLISSSIFHERLKERGVTRTKATVCRYMSKVGIKIHNRLFCFEKSCDDYLNGKAYG